MKESCQDHISISMIEKGIKLINDGILSDHDKVMDYLNQMNRVRRFLGFKTLKKSEFDCMITLSTEEKLNGTG